MSDTIIGVRCFKTELVEGGEGGGYHVTSYFRAVDNHGGIQTVSNFVIVEKGEQGTYILGATYGMKLVTA